MKILTFIQLCAISALLVIAGVGINTWYYWAIMTLICTYAMSWMYVVFSERRQ